MTILDKVAELPKWETHFEWNFLARYIPPCRVLDFGCGYGFSDFYLAGAGFTVHGYDLDTERIAIAQEIRSRRPTEIQERTSFSSEDFGTDPYALIWSSHVFEHLTDSDAESIVPFLESYGCTILISVPLGYAYSHPTHVQHWATAQEFSAWLSRYSKRNWLVWEDDENQVIKAKTA